MRTSSCERTSGAGSATFCRGRDWRRLSRLIRSLLVQSAGAAAIASSPAAQSAPRELYAEVFAGSAWSVPLPLVLRVDGTRSQFTARYSTRPFSDAPYYSYRFGRSVRQRAIELELLHHKLYLENPRAPVEHFEITHGFNHVMVNVAQPAHSWRWRVGLGVVVAHPEGRIAGRNVGPVRTLLGGGYQISGLATQFAFGRRYHASRESVVLTASPEVKLTAALARVRMEGGHLLVPNVALHALGGLGVLRRW